MFPTNEERTRLKRSLGRCRTASDYRRLREWATSYDLMSKVDQDTVNASPFLQIPRTPGVEFVMTQSPDDTETDQVYHKLLCLTDTHPGVFNPIAFGTSPERNIQYCLQLLDRYEAAAKAYAVEQGWDQGLGLFFHCYPFSSVNSLHMHVMHPYRYSKYGMLKGLPLKAIREVLEAELSTYILICGYCTSGKDTVQQQLSGVIRGYRWTVLGDSAKWEVITRLIPTSTRVSFAEALKNQVRVSLQLGDDYDIDANKTTIVGTQTIRSHLIEVAMAKRKLDPDYWVKTATQDLSVGSYVVTDFRFPNELDYLEASHRVFTIRVFRPDVIPPLTMSSEHQLDLLPTDVVLCPPGAEAELRAQFPQYSNYTVISYL